MLLVILLQVWHGYGKTLGTFSLAENSLFLQLLIVVKLAVISALHQMALVTIPPEHAVWMCFVSGIFIFNNFKECLASLFLWLHEWCSFFLGLKISNQTAILFLTDYIYKFSYYFLIFTVLDRLARIYKSYGVKNHLVSSWPT